MDKEQSNKRCLIVGTDKLGCAPEILKDRFGITSIIHWSGRKKPRKMNNLSLIVVYTGFANHCIVKEVKRLAQKNNIKTVYVNRGLSELVS